MPDIGHSYAPRKVGSLLAKLMYGLKEVAPEHSAGGSPAGLKGGKRAAKGAARGTGKTGGGKK
jgi:hypothetical protein